MTILGLPWLSCIAIGKGLNKFPGGEAGKMRSRPAMLVAGVVLNKDSGPPPLGGLNSFADRAVPR